MLVEEFSKHNNYSLKDIPFAKIANVDLKHPVLKEFMKEVMTTTVDGVPFAMALIYLLEHISTQIPVSQWGNYTVRSEIIKNITSQMGPYSNIFFNKTFGKLKNHSREVFSNLTEFGEYQVRKVGEIAINISDNSRGQLKNVTSTIVNYSGNAMNRSHLLMKLAGNLTQYQWNEVVEFLNRTKHLPGQFFENPLDSLAQMTNSALTIVSNTFKNFANFTTLLQRLTWEQLEDLGSLQLRARDITFSAINQAGNLSVGVARHYIGSVKNLSEMTMSMTPMQMFKFRSLDELVKSVKEIENRDNQNKTEGFLTSLPIVGGLPGVSVIQAIFEKFPKIILLSFDRLMDFFDIFRLRKK